MSEKYVPSMEEIEVAENMLTDDQREMTEKREQDFWFERGCEKHDKETIDRKIAAYAIRRDATWNVEANKEIAEDYQPEAWDSIERANERGEEVLEVEFNVPIKVKVPASYLLSDTRESLDNAVYYATNYLREVGKAKFLVEIAEKRPDFVAKLKRYQELSSELYQMWGWSNEHQCDVRSAIYDYDRAQEILDELDQISLELTGNTILSSYCRKITQGPLEELRDKISSRNKEYSREERDE